MFSFFVLDIKLITTAQENTNRAITIMNLTNSTMISTPSGLRSFAALKYMKMGSEEKVIAFETIDQFPMFVLGTSKITIKHRDHINNPQTILVEAKDLDIDQHVICIPIEQVERKCNIGITIDGEVQQMEDLDWFMIGSYAGTAKHFLDVKTLTPGWNILHEFEGVIPEWVQRLPKSDIVSFLEGFEANSAKPSWIPVKSQSIGLALQRLYAKVGRCTYAHYHEPAHYVIIDNTNRTVDSNYIYMIPTKVQYFDL